MDELNFDFTSSNASNHDPLTLAKFQKNLEIFFLDMGVRNFGVWTSVITFGHVWLAISRHAIEIFQYSFQLSIANG